jgi:hypothetical protein
MKWKVSKRDTLSDGTFYNFSDTAQISPQGFVSYGAPDYYAKMEYNFNIPVKAGDVVSLSFKVLQLDSPIDSEDPEMFYTLRINDRGSFFSFDTDGKWHVVNREFILEQDSEIVSIAITIMTSIGYNSKAPSPSPYIYIKKNAFKKFKGRIVIK